MDLESYMTAFSTKLRVRIGIILAGEHLTIKEIINNYEKKYKETKNRETIYRILEMFDERGIVNKKYDKEGKEIKYELLIDKATVDFIAEKVSFEE